MTLKAEFDIIKGADIDTTHHLQPVFMIFVTITLTRFTQLHGTLGFSKSSKKRLDLDWSHFDFFVLKSKISQKLSQSGFTKDLKLWLVLTVGLITREG